MGSVSEDELAGLNWMLEMLPQLHLRDSSHELLQYFQRRTHGWYWKNTGQHEAFLNRFWKRPDSWQDKPGAVVRMVTYGNYCLELKKALEQKPPTTA